jgi:hypothetical protein
MWSIQHPHGRILGFLDRGLYYFFQVASSAVLTPFQTHYFSENLVALGIEPETSGSVAKNSDHHTTEVVTPVAYRLL